MQSVLLEDILFYLNFIVIVKVLVRSSINF